MKISYLITLGLIVTVSIGVDYAFAANISVPQGTSVPGCETTNKCFIPYEVSIPVGGEVTWSNDDSAAHTVTAGSSGNGPSGVFDSSLFMAGTAFSHKFEESGIHPYFCMVHPWMNGIVNVGNPPYSSPESTETIITVQMNRPSTFYLDSSSQIIRAFVEVQNYNPSDGQYFMKVIYLPTNKVLKDSKIYLKESGNDLWSVQIGYPILESDIKVNGQTLFGEFEIEIRTEFSSQIASTKFSILESKDESQSEPESIPVPYSSPTSDPIPMPTPEPIPEPEEEFEDLDETTSTNPNLIKYENARYELDRCQRIQNTCNEQCRLGLCDTNECTDSYGCTSERIREYYELLNQQKYEETNCGSGTHLKNGLCVLDGAASVCGAGTVMKDGKCVPKDNNESPMDDTTGITTEEMTEDKTKNKGENGSFLDFFQVIFDWFKFDGNNNLEISKYEIDTSCELAYAVLDNIENNKGAPFEFDKEVIESIPKEIQQNNAEMVKDKGLVWMQSEEGIQAGQDIWDELEQRQIDHVMDYNSIHPELRNSVELVVLDPFSANTTPEIIEVFNTMYLIQPEPYREDPQCGKQFHERFGDQTYDALYRLLGKQGASTEYESLKKIIYEN